MDNDINLLKWWFSFFFISLSLFLQSFIITLTTMINPRYVSQHIWRGMIKIEIQMFSYSFRTRAHIIYAIGNKMYTKAFFDKIIVKSCVCFAFISCHKKYQYFPIIVKYLQSLQNILFCHTHNPKKK